MKPKMKLCDVGVFCLVFSLAAGAARAQGVTVAPENPVIASGDSQQFTATGNLTPSLVSASGSHSCALLPDNTLRCWGYNEHGQLGDGTTSNRSTPVAVAGITSATAVSAGHHHTCALLADGTVGCWGENEWGQLGNGATTPNAPTPVVVSGITTAVAVTTGAYHSCAILVDGVVQCWGLNEFGQLGNGTFVDSSTPVTVAGLAGAPITVTAGGFHTCALLPDGAVQCWGRNDYGQLGDGSTPNSFIPVSVTGLGPAAALSAGGFHACALMSDRTLKCWGQNIFGQLGDGSSISYVAPAEVLGFTPVYSSNLPPGSHSRTPVQVADITTAAAVTAGGFHTCASLSDGSAKCWGQNDYGQRGDGTTSASSTPEGVSGLDASARVSAAAWHTCALLPDGTVSCWGRNFAGQLGDGTVINSSTPVAVTGTGPVTWTSSDSVVATIDAATGLATARSSGSTTITAAAHGLSGSTVLTVVSNVVTLTVTRDGPGTVASDPAGIYCGTQCAAPFVSGTMVALTATPDPGFTFMGWSGGPCYGVGTCWVILTANTTVNARFHPTSDTATLTVSKDGAGTGHVRSDPRGINCGTQCSAPFVRGTVVTLTATADSGSTFDGWMGGGCIGTGRCTVIVAADTTVVAHFKK